MHRHRAKRPRNLCRQTPRPLPIAWIDTDPAKLLRQWNSQHPEWLINKGEKKFRIEDTIPGGGATIETFNTATRLYMSMSGFKDKDSALKFLERAGF
ncbi:hypothetical protein [Nocardia salmonicida]|uniref:hypothetical protein n=1 Tax=Nocardia salmonicida TaxID=53431 RepID=UPI0036451B77